MPRDTLTSEQIVAAAVELLDEAGLDGLNMRALGARLGSAATAMYWHVGSKANLIVLAGDSVWSEIALPDLASVPWREAATQMATELYAMLTKHLWLVRAFGSYVIFGPGKARHDEHSLAVYESLGLPAGEADQAASAVFTFVLGNALGPAATDSLARGRTHERRGAGAAEQLDASMARAREVAAQFPRLRARLGTTAAGYGASPAESFELGLEAILDGLQARARRES